MESLIAPFVQFVENNQTWAGPLVGLLTFGESLAIVGVLLPGTAVLLVVGGLIGAGVLEPLPVLIGAVIGAVLGDIVSFYLGAWLGRGVVHRWPLNQHKEAVARARLFFRRYGFATIFLGRFFGPVRAMVPLVAGMMSMDWRRFQLANVLSALVWAPAVLAPGWLVARGAVSFVELGEGDWLLVSGGAVIAGTLATILGLWLFRIATRRQPRGDRQVARDAGSISPSGGP